jgi:rhodanese-related sulfurtransferase
MRIHFFLFLFSGLIACNQKTTNGKTIIVDVRSEITWKQGHGQGINIPLPQLEKHKAELLQYDTVIFVCETGASAQQATSYMNTQKDRKTVFMNGVSWTNYQDCP